LQPDTFLNGHTKRIIRIHFARTFQRKEPNVLTIDVRLKPLPLLALLVSEAGLEPARSPIRPSNVICLISCCPLKDYPQQPAGIFYLTAARLLIPLLLHPSRRYIHKGFNLRNKPRPLRSISHVVNPMSYVPRTAYHILYYHVTYNVQHIFSKFFL